MEYVLDQRKVSVGRGPGVDLALEESSLAGRHAWLTFEDGGFTLSRVSEDNEIRVNGRSEDRVVLKADDQFKLGDLDFSYVLVPKSYL